MIVTIDKSVKKELLTPVFPTDSFQTVHLNFTKPPCSDHRAASISFRYLLLITSSTTMPRQKWYEFVGPSDRFSLFAYDHNTVATPNAAIVDFEAIAIIDYTSRETDVR